MGAWIEILDTSGFAMIDTSLPLWERGLKYLKRVGKPLVTPVAPLVGAWIDIHTEGNYTTALDCRSPCGSVD